MSGGSARIRIVAVDDHPLVRQGIPGRVEVQPDMTWSQEPATVATQSTFSARTVQGSLGASLVSPGPETIINAPRSSCTTAAETKREPAGRLGLSLTRLHAGRSRGATQLTHAPRHRREPHGTKLESRVSFVSPRRLPARGRASSRSAIQQSRISPPSGRRRQAPRQCGSRPRQARPGQCEGLRCGGETD